jgi:hypothetical protein
MVRTHKLVVVVNEDEREKIRRMAASEHLAPSSFMRRLLLTEAQRRDLGEPVVVELGQPEPAGREE